MHEKGERVVTKEPTAPKFKSVGLKGELRFFWSELKSFFDIKRWFKSLFTGKIREFFTSGSFDLAFFALVIYLVSVGVVMMFSASYVAARNGADTNYNPYYYFINQLKFAAIGIVVMLLVSRLKVDLFRSFSGLIGLVSLILLIYVLINPKIIAGKEESKRWIDLGVMDYQPSELAKLGIIMLFSFMMERYRTKTEEKAWMMLIYAGILGVFCLLIYKENHLSGALIVLLIGGVMMFFGGVKLRWFVIVGVIAAIAASVVIATPEKFLPEHAVPRIEIWKKLLAGKELTSEETKGDAWQTLQSLYAVGSGGLFGVGFGKSRQKYLYLPEPQNDFVFSVICEELGFFPTLLIVIIPFILLLARGFTIALRARSRYAKLLALGISVQVALQAGLNIAVVTSTVPNTGISLPFFSYGGSSLVTLLIEMGMVLAVSRNDERKRTNAQR